VLIAVINREGSISAAAAFLGVTRQTVHRWVREYGIRVSLGRLAA